MFAASKTDGVSGGYQISRSLRFNSADSTYLNRTPASATNRRTWTWSAWVKRSALGTVQELFDGYWANTDNGYFWVGFTSADAFEVQLYNSTLRTTTQVFRDPSAWYHFVLAVDTTQATAANRVKVYLNGSEITTFSTNNAPTQNLDTAVNYNGAHYIGTFSGTTNLFNGYQTEINLIDGQALTPSSFGETNAQTGVWQPKAYSGSYGTNGFYLNFSDNSNTTAATLGKDYSGNGNNWTPNNFSVTAGAGNDSLVDSPTSYGTDTGVGGTVRGNYATWNAVANPSGTLANGNLQITGGTTRGVWGTIGLTSGKWYWEFDIVSASLANGPYFGFSNFASTGSQGTVYGLLRSNAGQNASTGVTSSTAGSGNIDSGTVGVAIDLDAGTATIYHNNTTRLTVSAIPTGTYYPFFLADNAADQFYLNAGQRPFAYTAPSGYKALCTQNLPTPTIGATSTTLANKYFNSVLYTGNSSTQTISGVGFQPDLVWIKCRSNARNHVWGDVLRGSTYRLSSNLTSAESNVTNGITAFTSDGFSLGDDGQANNLNETEVAWNWKANGSGSTNTAGSITSTVSANTTSGFSIVTYTGTGANATVGHGLGVAPSMVIVKSRSTVDGWFVYNKEIGNTKYLRLNTTDAAATFNLWQSTTPTSTVFSIATDPTVNGSGNTYVAYCFAEVAGYSKFGSYTGNGSADGPFVFTGFRPAYLLVKRSDAAYDWWVFDSKRLGYNVTSARLSPDLSDAEYTTGSIVDFTSNGFKIRDASQGWNGSGGTIIYMAFAETPLKFSLAR